MIDIDIPDDTTLSRRGGGLAILPKRESSHRTIASAGRQHRAEDLRRGRLAR
jgi:transposase